MKANLALVQHALGVGLAIATVIAVFAGQGPVVWDRVFFAMLIVVVLILSAIATNRHHD